MRLDAMFKYGSYDTIDNMHFKLCGVTLNRPIGPYPMGTKFEEVHIDLVRGRISLYGTGAVDDLTVSLEIGGPV